MYVLAKVVPELASKLAIKPSKFEKLFPVEPMREVLMTPEVAPKLELLVEPQTKTLP